MKIVRWILLAVVLLVVLAAGVAFIFVDSIVRATIARGGTHATGVATTLDSADVGILDGKLELEDFMIANPEGFESKSFLTFGKVDAAWQNRTLVSDAIEIDQIAIDGVGLDLERTKGRTNFGLILDNLGKLSKGGPPTSGEPPGKKRTLHVKRIVVTDIRASARVTDLGLAPISVHVPKIEIADFRSDGSTGELVGKLVAALVPAILNATLENGSSLLPKELLRDMEAQLGQWKGELEGAKKKLKDLEGILKGGDVDGALKGIEDIFKKPR